MTDARHRPGLLMVCAHEPRLDPRIRWEAETASARFAVTVLGFAGENAAPGSMADDGYRVVRLRRPAVGGIRYFWWWKGVIGRPAWLTLGAVLLLAAPLALLIDAASRVSRAAVGRRGGGTAPAAAANGRRGGRTMPRLAGWLRRRLPGRVEHIARVMRTQFAPAAAAFWPYLRAMPVKPDVVHCNDLDTLLVGVLAKRHYGCRLIYDAHEFYPVSNPHGGRLDRAFFALIERRLIRQTDAVVTVNPPLAEAMRAAYRLARVYAAPNAEPWIAPRPPCRDGAMTGLARGRRGIEELIAGWARVDADRAALFLRGPDNRWRRSAIELAAGLGLLDRSVYFLDAVAEDQLVCAAAEADIGVIPYKPVILNDRLSCPNKLSQYLHAGLMVIANDLPYVRAVLSEAQAGLFYNSADPASLAAQVAAVLDDPGLVQRGRANALRFARECFNWQVQGEIFDALYRATAAHQEPEPAAASQAIRCPAEAAAMPRPAPLIKGSN